ncbi:lysozyme inhibitor LprI family protein [Vibrio sp. T11.5]|uniref:lysozyme inhibitor LprI family protein n=1 Tax=Vibrio sp. T11.5 TaxID=2998836 RepID=UPI0022CD52FF|nr:lysozyme inhibitor LprI family protein [Vibrio sp. T11.5]MDA0118037.1 lysozyme inhibitor LprI family protein [Vibrio sp. T11.5]
MKIQLFLMALLVVPSFFLEAASFDCTKAVSSAEKMICREPILNTFDEILGAKYRDLRSLLSPQQQKILKKEQLEWWEQRDGQCSYGVSECIPIYGQRIGELHHQIALESLKRELPNVTSMDQLINNPNFLEFLAARYNRLYDSVVETEDYVREMGSIGAMYRALKGKGDDLVFENGLLFGSACSKVSCRGKKGFILVDPETLDAVFGAISFYDTLDRYFPDNPQLILFYSNDEFFEQNKNFIVNRVKTTTKVTKVVPVRAYDFEYDTYEY